MMLGWVWELFGSFVCMGEDDDDDNISRYISSRMQYYIM